MAWWNIALNAAKLVSNVIVNLPFAANGAANGAVYGEYKTGGLLWTATPPSTKNGQSAVGIHVENTGDIGGMGVSFAVSNAEQAVTDYWLFEKGESADLTEVSAMFRDGTVTIAPVEETGSEGTGEDAKRLMRAVSFSIRTLPLSTPVFMVPGVELEFQKEESGAMRASLRLQNPITHGKFSLVVKSTVGEEVRIEREIHKRDAKSSGEYHFPLPEGFTVPSVIARAEARLEMDLASFQTISAACKSRLK